ncbi:transposon, En/Spm-like protein [Tanacetum coccineum]
MFRINIVNDNIGSSFMSTSKLNDSILWHARLGHVHFKRMQDISKDGLIPTFNMDTEKCKTCMMTKITKKPFQNVKHETKVLELIYSDLCDLHATLSLGNNKYFVTFINDASREEGTSNWKDIPYKYMHYLPLTPRFQRLYMSKGTAQYMTWHHENRRQPGVLSHPSDGEAWKNFDQRHPQFAAELRNVRLGLCTDGFTPFGMSPTTYSCWPVIVTPYNLPPWMCMKIPYMFSTLIILGPHSPKNNIDVFLEPLIDELIQLWSDGVDIYDAFRENNFKLKVALMCTINDFPAHGMLSGCNTHGRLSCPTVGRSSGLRYEMSEKKVDEVDFISQRVDLLEDDIEILMMRERCRREV